jgi:hypothetical protein
MASTFVPYETAAPKAEGMVGKVTGPAVKATTLTPVEVEL